MPANPQPTEEVLSLVRACGPLINGIHTSELAKAFAPPARSGALPAEPTKEQFDKVYLTARQLCDAGNYHFAAGLALHLFTYKPGDPRFGFIAGTCMQHLGAYASAAKFYCYALIAGGDHPGVLFRLGECLLALGDTAKAERAFDASMDASRGNEEAGEVQLAAQELLDALRKGGAGKPS